jgi:hypothetical protein
VRSENVLQKVKVDRKFLQTIKIWKTNWIGHILHMNCHLKHVTEEKLREKYKWQEYKEDKCSYQITLRKREDTQNWKRKH